MGYSDSIDFNGLTIEHSKTTPSPGSPGLLKKLKDFGFISYSDQPPGSHADDEFGHSKGVVMVEEGKSGVWLLHSTPQFPFSIDQNHFWPQSGAKHAQTFICVTFPHDQFIAIGKHLQYIKAFPFDHHVPDVFPEFINVVNWKSITPSNDKQPLTSNGLQPFFSIAKLQFKDCLHSV
ncbi:deoxyribonuclease-2-alpha-like [Cottoperca gobio]|uniref:Deoxyribonuclease-2-alpha n=1 Tax=Cottoperca gobio TaxID=56716 RepID=A0A6J2QQJ3_COTGO|nr:deoxyribonuclease-2-alpha-like [Cottoperca gobio]